VFDHVVVRGEPYERGFQYGQQASAAVAQSREAYEEVLADATGWSWRRVCEEAQLFVGPMERFEPKFMDEMRGIAAGAGLDDIDVFAMNLRSEIMFGASAREAGGSAHVDRLVPECTSFALMGERAVDGRMLIGQTWDWLGHALDTTVILEAHQDDGPDFVTVVEAGLLAKFGMNSSGIGVCTNALVCGWDAGEPGVPVHLLLRAILDSEAIPDAVSAIARGTRASSANYLIADEDGLAIDIEAAPGGYERLYIGYPDRGLILHTNHFTTREFDGHDVAPYAMPDSPFRLQRLRQLIEHVPQLDRETFQSAFADHATFPFGICCHPDPRAKESQRWETVAATVMDIEARQLWLASGNPCTTPFELVDLSDVLSKPSPVRHGATARLE
jgi:isopenicillin-N N-acyltransferase-like protein